MRDGLLSEQRMSFAELARHQSVSTPTVWRWSKRGVRGVQLESIAIGGRRYTTWEAYARFVERTTAAATGTARVVPSTSTSQASRRRAAAIAAAEAELRDAGV
ncbi:MAG: DUF1580 domain-containing protein [Planctomycetales bacterium]|nr:DUF1580 domain-containing protein [Planctomycetales bacterium]